MMVNNGTYIYMIKGILRIYDVLFSCVLWFSKYLYIYLYIYIHTILFVYILKAEKNFFL